MGQVVSLTDKPVRVTLSTDAEELRLALDVLEHDELDLTLHVLSVAGGGTPSVTIGIETGNQIDSTSGWNVISSFLAKTASDQSELKNFKGLQRFVRWKVTAMAGTTPAFVFTIQGVGRRWS